MPARFCPPLSHHHTLLVTIFMHAQLKVHHSNTPLMNISNQHFMDALVGYGSLIYTFHLIIPMPNKFDEEWLFFYFGPIVLSIFETEQSNRSYDMVYLTYIILDGNHFSIDILLRKYCIYKINLHLFYTTKRKKKTLDK